MRYFKYTTIVLSCFLFFSCAEKEDARKPITHASGSFLKKSIEINKQLIAQEEKIFDSIMNSNPDNKYHLTKKGYWYTLINDSLSESYLPVAGDLVYFDSEILSVTGDTIYKFGELKTREYMVDKEEIIIGLRDGLKRLRKGDKAQFLFPSHVAYGYVGDKNRIGMNVPIIYNVSVLDIKKQNDTLK